MNLAQAAFGSAVMISIAANAIASDALSGNGLAPQTGTESLASRFPGSQASSSVANNPSTHAVPVLARRPLVSPDRHLEPSSVIRQSPSRDNEQSGANDHILCTPANPQTGAGASRDEARLVHKVLFLGNSITRHGPSQAIGWTGDWGMAASSRNKDYVHLVVRSLAEKSGKAPEVMILNIAEFERQFATFAIDAKLSEAFQFAADLVIVAIGENVPPLSSEESKRQFANSLTKLLTGLKSNNQPTIVVRSCFWADRAKDEILKQACQDAGGIYVDIGQLGKDESNYARSERSFTHEGVAAHPGDKGMHAIADAILGAVDNQGPLAAATVD